MQREEVQPFDTGNGSKPPPPTPTEHLANLVCRLTSAVERAISHIDRFERPRRWLLGGIIFTSSGILVVLIYLAVLARDILQRLTPPPSLVMASADIVDKTADSFLEKGILGSLIVVLAVVVFLKDREVTKEKDGRLADAKAKDAALIAEQQARIEDAKAVHGVILKMQGEVIGAVDKIGTIGERLSDVGDKLADLMQSIERREREREFEHRGR